MKDNGNTKTPLEERVYRFIQKNRLIKSGELLLVGVSGGADSTCLILLLNELAERLDVKLHIAHLNHRLRGKESDSDARYVKTLARRLNIPATIEARDVKVYQTKNRKTLEEAAREVRYAFFAGLAGKLGAKKVAVGHTANDHVETVLMHLIRGSGVRGLIGLRPLNTLRFQSNEITVVRPLLEVTRKETEEYCRQHGIKPRIDSTNLSLSTMRNRIRLELIPLLKKYNPEIEKAIMRTAQIATDDIAFIDSATEKKAHSIFKQEEDMIFLDREKLLKLPTALRRSIIRLAIERLTGDTRNLEMGHIEDILEVLDKPAGKSISLPQGLIFVNDYNRYILVKDKAALSPYPELKGEARLKIPGTTVFSGWNIKATISNRSAVKSLKSRDPFTALFDFDRVGRELSVRGWRRGDRFQPLGMPETKKVGEFLIDAKVPRHQRNNVPIVASPSQIVWLAGVRMDERVKVTDSTKKVLKLRFQLDSELAAGDDLS